MRLLVLLLLLLNIAPARASIGSVTSGLLHADGLVTVQGADPSETTITVVPASGASYDLAKGTKDFKLELPLNDTYLVIFAHPKCLTKQLYFDTRVPEDYALDHYTFPFEVILEVQLAEDRSYVGPVGYIMYKELVNDFDYETDYTLQIDEKLKQRMNSLNTAASAPTVPAATERAPTSSAGTVATSTASSTVEREIPNTPSPTATVIGARTADRVQAVPVSPPPIEREAAPTTLTSIEIDPEVEADQKQTPVAVEVAEVPISEPPVIEEETEVPASEPIVVDEEVEEPIVTEPVEETAEVVPAVPEATENTGPSVSDEKIETEIASTTASQSGSSEMRLPSNSRRVAREFVAPDPMKFGRQEELIVEGNKVTTIVRIVNELGYQHEYRRVAHKFGPVFYFKDDQSIPAHMYTDSTGLPAN